MWDYYCIRFEIYFRPPYYYFKIHLDGQLIPGQRSFILPNTSRQTKYFDHVHFATQFYPPPCFTVIYGRIRLQWMFGFLFTVYFRSHLTKSLSELWIREWNPMFNSDWMHSLINSYLYVDYMPFTHSLDIHINRAVIATYDEMPVFVLTSHSCGHYHWLLSVCWVIFYKI